MDLNKLRENIDQIDSELIDLLAKRFKVTSEIAQYKRSHGLPIFVPEREREILDRLSKIDEETLPTGGLKLLYAIILDLNKLDEYLSCPEPLEVPTHMGGASVRAILSNEPRTLCRYLSALAAAEVTVTKISSTALPGGKLVVDIELSGRTDDPRCMAALSVLADTAEQFMLL
jgi:chorismate mutase